MSSNPWYRRLCLIATLLFFCVILMGAYTRLVDGGLGCPDWPGCYGQLTVPHNTPALLKAHALYPELHVEPQKAWSEMIHRYMAGTVAFLTFLIAGLSFYASRKERTFPVLPLTLVALIVFQALLGKWTVTLKLFPIIVTSHLLGGFLLFATLALLTLQAHQRFLLSIPETWKPFRYWALLGLIILFLQIFLGGWTSTNYAALVCPHLPNCYAQGSPHLDFQQGFNFFFQFGANHEGGRLMTAARVAIQMTHRYGALITSLYWLTFCITLFKKCPASHLSQWARWILVLLGLQVLWGCLNVLYLLPLPIALLHNGTAALLFASIAALTYQLFHPTRIAS